MRWLFTSLGEFRFKYWLDKHASDVLTEVGVGTGCVMLDFGCGSGTYTIPAAKLVGDSGKVYAVDISRSALDRLENKAKQEGLRNIIRIDALMEGEISIDDEILDLMLLIDVLQEIDDKETLFQEAYRIIKPGGVLTIYPMHIAKEEVERLATNSGFNIQERTVQGHLLIFRKEDDHRSERYEKGRGD